MADEKEIKVPDIGGASGVDVIELLVKEGDEISKDTPLVTLESDKASMEIPSPEAGVVRSIRMKVGDKVSEGDLILMLSSNAQTSKPSKESKAPLSTKSEEVKSTNAEPVQSSAEKNIKVPDIGGASGVDVIELLVKEGDEISKDTPLVTLESDKASMEIPSSEAGIVRSIRIKVGDKVSEGDIILTLSANAQSTQPAQESKATSSTKSEEIPDDHDSARAPVIAEKVMTSSVSSARSTHDLTSISAGPSARRLARELGVNLAEVQGSGRKSRVSKEDIQQFVKAKLQEKSTGGIAVSAAPSIDFSKFGEIEVKPLNKIKRLTGANVHRAWVTIPHVTQFDEADITELEAFRKAELANIKDSEVKLTILAFVCKVVSKALAIYPQFNTSLDVSGENLIYKNYCNIGVAVETPNGLVVPVIKDVDRLSVSEIAKEMTRLSAKAREKGLMPADMSGGCFTISSLGGIGGTAFTPIVNSPEVAILGLSRSIMKPVYIQGEFKPRLMLPLSLSYDHRVIDGAEAARFTRFIGDGLSDIRKILL